jgi:ATP-binding cassette subfamily B protein
MASGQQDDEIIGKAYDSRLMRRLMKYLRPYWQLTVLSLLTTLVYGILQAAPAYLMKVEVDRYLDPKGQPISPLLANHLSHDPLVGILQISLALFLPAVLLSFVLEFAQSFAMQLVGQRVMYDLRKEIFLHLQRLELAFFDRNPVGRLVTRVTTDVDVLNDLFASGVVAICGDFFTLLSIMVVMLHMNWKLALLTFAVLPMIGIATAMFRRSVRDSYRRIRTAIARINAYLQEHLTGIAVIQLFNREERSFQEFELANRAHMEAYKDSILAYGLFFPAVELFGVIAVAIIIYACGGMTVRGAFDVGLAIAFIQYSQRFFRPIQDLSDKYNILQAAMASAERVFKLLDTPVAIVDPPNPQPLPEPEGRVEFNHVGFAYKDNHKVLDDINFALNPGETVAVVGHTGAGKTTLTNLLLRYYDPQEGSITFDGIDIRSLTLSDLRKNFAIVLQDPFLFSGTIASNIRLGNSSITDAEVDAAAEQVNLKRFIESLPAGFDEPVKERGATLSVGQKQLLSFARALAFDPRILILDEATSSVDPETEHLLREGMKRLIHNRTSLVIAHRLSTIQNANRIVVMHKGRVREVGTHQYLLELRGIYFKLYQLQYKDQEMPPAPLSAASEPLAERQ